MAHISQKMCQILSWAFSLWVDSAQDSDLAHFLRDLSQSEKLSEIKPLLAFEWEFYVFEPDSCWFRRQVWHIIFEQNLNFPSIVPESAAFHLGKNIMLRPDTTFLIIISVLIIEIVSFDSSLKTEINISDKKINFQKSFCVIFHFFFNSNQNKSKITFILNKIVTHSWTWDIISFLFSSSVN